jgi:hypothetical protein
MVVATPTQEHFQTSNHGKLCAVGGDTQLLLQPKIQKFNIIYIRTLK